MIHFILIGFGYVILWAFAFVLTVYIFDRVVKPEDWGDSFMHIISVGSIFATAITVLVWWFS
ncbi:hypothetical protein JQX09_22485 [Sulfitobacter pseudonitzschiae]|uniref:Uncharacterized protein n=1 Tax=Pseudosulfitobacter pseudonitzschiae TaxID=1402135 RepID=A0A9Q2RX92_9RHOB|nr:hypothetical protein [Pseudosulfitobacter pseudonitzschiae]MBM2294695.1 hypothetical protein [Pseudosulfitobacter pseudonitzschiae]MBM2299632.1 hypothetical protein [Pseudosulfitobacter pseudonitzschiae]MBM2304531.1 hypothetical protein [Pseudosulfitobacter pseudonitzschiae]MBM2314306.1 hypothetical protein [Pseudosulfitobacter pseudonitzschiae]MBM2319222.1 hypothetical protein [Pseudosulfitobacter pseudonitzschiae]